MTEPGPISFSLLALSVAALGPVVGPYALLIFAAGVGAGLALSVEKVEGLWAGFRFWLMATIVALLLTGPCVWAVSTFTSVPAHIALIPVALLLGAAKPQIAALVKQLLDMIVAAVSSALQAAANRKGGGQ
jgi:hypothetical protein